MMARAAVNLPSVPHLKRQHRLMPPVRHPDMRMRDRAMAWEPETAALSDAAWVEAGRWLGLGLRNATTMLAPEVIVLGGGVVSGSGERLLAPARAELAAGLRLVPVPAVRASLLGYDSALHGALVLAALAAGVDPERWEQDS